MRSHFVDLNMINLTHSTCWHSVDAYATVGNFNLFSAISAANINRTNELPDAMSFIRLKQSKELHNFGGHMEGLSRFIYHYMDLNTMEDRTVKRRYKYPEQFYADARTILHDIFVCYGGLCYTISFLTFDVSTSFGTLAEVQGFQMLAEMSVTEQ